MQCAPDQPHVPHAAPAQHGTWGHSGARAGCGTLPRQAPHTACSTHWLQPPCDVQPVPGTVHMQWIGPGSVHAACNTLVHEPEAVLQAEG